MDGSTVVIPSATLPGGLARDDALFRIVYYGEALRAMTEHVSDTLISGPCVPMIELLDEAFDRMSDTRDNFGPEEFTLFVMSKMLGLCDDADEARQFQVGAAQYILKSADALPEAYQAVVDDARQMLNRSEISDATAPQARDADAAQDLPAPEEAPAPDAPAPDAADQKATGGEPAAETAPDAPMGENSAAVPAPKAEAAAPAPGGRGRDALKATAATGRGTTGGAASPHSRGADHHQPRMHLSQGRGAAAGGGARLEVFIAVALVAFGIGFMAMYSMGLVDTRDEPVETDRTPAFVTQ